MINRLTQKNFIPGPWWVFFPMLRLDITDAEPDFDSPMFGDCTIISARHVDQAVEWLYAHRQVDDADRADYDLRKDDLIRTMRNLTAPAPCDAFVVVRDSNSINEQRPKDPLDSQAGLRARQVASCLGLMLLADGAMPLQSCSLLMQARFRVGSSALINQFLEEAQLYQNNDISQLSVYGGPTLKRNRAEILALTQKEPYRDLGTILLHHRTLGLKVAFTKGVSEIAGRLFDAINANDPTTALLNAVIALEMLVRSEAGGENYNKVEGRVDALLGKDAVTKYNLKFILTHRHKLVHQGRDLERYSLLSPRAIGLVMACLFRYASAGLYFQHLPSLVSYLDLVIAGDNIREHWNVADQQAFDSLLKHEREGIYYKWQKGPLDLQNGPYDPRHVLQGSAP